jgi:hypothetical protein
MKLNGDLEKITKQSNRYFTNASMFDRQEIDTSSKPFLSAKVNLPDNATAKESVLGQIEDTAKADLFSYNAPNDLNGVNNSLFLDNLKNEYTIRFKEPLYEPRTEDNKPNENGFEPIKAFEDELNVDKAIAKVVGDQVNAIQTLQNVTRIGPLCYTGGNRRQVEPFKRDKMKPSDFVPIDLVSPAMNIDLSKTTPMYYTDFLGYKLPFSKWRQPELPDYQTTYDQIQSPAYQYDQVMYNIGSDYLY